MPTCSHLISLKEPNMKAVTVLLVALLALASGKPLTPVPILYQASVVPFPFSQFGTFPQPYTAVSAVARFNGPSSPVSTVPVLKDASGVPVSPAITPVYFHYPYPIGNSVALLKDSSAGQSSPAFVQEFPAKVHSFDVPFSKYHAQGDDGSYTFAYSGGPSSKTETRDQFGNIQGAFSYIDPTGKVQTQQYVADSVGFRVAATNLPLAPVVNKEENSKPVDDTEEKPSSVKRTKREADPAFISATTYTAPSNTAPLPIVYKANVPGNYFGSFRSVVSPSVYTVPNALPITYAGTGPAPPVYFKGGDTAILHTIPTPLVYVTNNPSFTFKPGTLTKIVHNPGHAVSYRVDV